QNSCDANASRLGGRVKPGHGEIWSLPMHSVVTAGAGFLLAVLWFDLMFDVQTRTSRDGTLPPEVLASIAGYYRRVTTDARPMNRLVSLVMLATVLALGAEIFEDQNPVWLEAMSVACAISAIGLAIARTFRNAVVL